MKRRDGVTVLAAHPSPDLYGSDRQFVEDVRALRGAGHTVVVSVPRAGRLTALLEAEGATVRYDEFPVLRRALISARGFVSLALHTPLTLWRIIAAIRAVRPDVIFVNTVTIPWWVVAARLARVRVVVHVHEAEEGLARSARYLLSMPMALASAIIANSHASRRVLLQSVGPMVRARLTRRSTVIHNGLAGPDAAAPADGVAAGPARLVLVGRLSPRKGVDVAVEALAMLRAEGRDVVLDVCGTAFVGYEWFERTMRERTSEPDLAGAVTFRGYVHPTWPLLAQASVVLAPSLGESFGNTAVEGMLAARPVVASAVLGLSEILSDGRTGLLVPPGDARALADAVARLLDDPGLALKLSEQGRAEALERFSITRYHQDIAAAVQQQVDR